MFVSSVDDKFVVCNDDKIGYDYLIGADGSSSVVRKYLGLDSKSMGLAIQYIVKGDMPLLELYFDMKKFGSWYSWIFPNNGFYSIGIGAALDDINSASMRRKLDEFCVEKGIDIANSRFEAALINMDYRGFKFGNVYLVGDAAGLAFGFSGEGIYSAIVSGEMAGKSIIDKKYDFNRVLSRIIKHKQHQEFLIPLMKYRYSNYLISYFLPMILRTHFGKKLFLNVFG